MATRNQRSRTLGTIILLGTVLTVVAFGRRESQPAAKSKSDGLTLRHPFSLNIDDPNNHVVPATNWAGKPVSRYEQRTSFQQESLVGLPAQTPLGQTFAKAVQTPELPAAQRTHRIVEGDSLEQLAAKYLGSRDRHMELFHANQHVLERPDVLPLGKRLNIPSARQAARAPIAPAPFPRTDSPLAPLPSK